MTSVFDLNLSPHISPIYLSINFWFGLWFLNCIIELYKCGNPFTVSFSIALYFYCGTVFAQRRLSKSTVMSKNWYVKNGSQTSKAVNARCILSDFRIQRDTRSWVNRQAYNYSHMVGKTHDTYMLYFLGFLGLPLQLFMTICWDNLISWQFMHIR